MNPKKFKVILSKKAINQIEAYIDFIAEEYSAPLTAYRHYKQLQLAIDDLQCSAHLNPVRHTRYLQRNYGFYVRRLNFRNMTFIYSIYADNVVYIHQFLPQKSIVD